MREVRVDLVHENEGQGSVARTSGLEHRREHHAVTGTDGRTGLNHRDHDVDVVGGGPGGVVEATAEGGLRPVQTRRVDEDDLGVAVGHDPRIA